MRVLCIDTEGMMLDFALRCIEADHEVRLFRIDAGKTKDGQGFRKLSIIDDWESSMAWCREGLILISGNFKYMDRLDRYREIGYKIFGPTRASADLEIKRSVGLEAMKAVGIDVPPYETFGSLEDAGKFARKSDKSFVFKTMGDEDDKSLSYVSSDPADLCGWIQQKIDRGMVLKGPCILQEKIDMIAELGVSGWVGPEGFLPNRWNLCFEFKKFYPGDVGQNVGEQGSVLQYVEEDKLAADTLAPMEAILRVMDHTGDFAINCGIDSAGKAWPFEFTARCGFPAWFIQTASHKGDPAQWMRDLLDGKDSLKVSRDVAIGVVCSRPPYPETKGPAAASVEGNPISGLDDVMDDVHLVNAMVGRGPMMKDGKIVDGRTFQTTGGYVLVATGLGKTVEKARKAVYGTVDRIKFADMGYRNDIGAKLGDCLPELHRLGYATEMEFS